MPGVKHWLGIGDRGSIPDWLQSPDQIPQKYLCETPKLRCASVGLVGFNFSRVLYKVKKINVVLCPPIYAYSAAHVGDRGAIPPYLQRVRKASVE